MNVVTIPIVHEVSPTMRLLYQIELQNSTRWRHVQTTVFRRDPDEHSAFPNLDDPSYKDGIHCSGKYTKDGLPTIMIMYSSHMHEVPADSPFRMQMTDEQVEDAIIQHLKNKLTKVNPK